MTRSRLLWYPQGQRRDKVNPPSSPLHVVAASPVGRIRRWPVRLCRPSLIRPRLDKQRISVGSDPGENRAKTSNCSLVGLLRDTQLASIQPLGFALVPMPLHGVGQANDSSIHDSLTCTEGQPAPSLTRSSSIIFVSSKASSCLPGSAAKGRPSQAWLPHHGRGSLTAVPGQQAQPRQCQHGGLGRVRLLPRRTTWAGICPWPNKTSATPAECSGESEYAVMCANGALSEAVPTRPRDFLRKEVERTPHLSQTVERKPFLLMHLNATSKHAQRRRVGRNETERQVQIRFTVQIESRPWD